MAQESEEKKHLPTQHKLRELRRDGQWYSSKELTHAIQLVVAAGCAGAAGSWLANRLRALFIDCLSPEHFRAADRFTALAARAWSEMLILTLPWAILMALFAGVPLIIQVRPMFAVKPLTPNFQRINPFEGIKRMFFKPQSWRNFAMNLVKFAVIAGFLYPSVRSAVRPLANVPEAGLAAAGVLTWSLVVGVMWKAAAVFIPLGMIDYLQRKRDFIKQNMMTDEELRREIKEEEQSPETRGRIHRRRREIFAGLQEGGLEDVHRAAVTITGNSGQVVALAYDPRKDPAAGLPPTVLAKGTGHYGRQIQWRTHAHRIPTRRDPVLAESLFRIELGTYIPEELYEPMRLILDELENLPPAPSDEEEDVT